MSTHEEYHDETDYIIGVLQQKKESLEKKLSDVGKLDLLINVITYKIFETQHEYRKKMQELCAEREEISIKKDVPSAKIAMEVAEIDKRMNDLRNMHEENMSNLEGQRRELRQECAIKTQHMDETMQILQSQHDTILDELETSKLHASPSEIADICAKIEELNKLYRNDIEVLYKLQKDGWKKYDHQERVAATLEERGLQITASGNFLTKSGNVLSKSEAVDLGLLDGLDIESSSEFQKQSQDEHTKSLHSTTSESSGGSKIDSNDVEYLRAVFGRPLTLALAEISAKQPRDPIHYLAHWLFKYRYNQEISIAKKHEIQCLIDERERLEREKLHAMYEEEARAAVLDTIIRAEEEAIRKELERIAREAMALEAEEEGLDAEARDSLGVYNGPTTGR